jgi:flagellar biogenesis protein FliO
MIRRTLLVGITACSLSLLAPLAMAEPSVPQVIQSIQSGHYDQAQQQLSEVLAAHPKSAQAQYLEARLLAKQGKWQEAAAALSKAKALDPSLSFVQPKALASFEQQLQKHSKQSAPVTAQKSHLGSALGWFLGLIAIIAGISWFMRRRRQAMAYRQMQPQGFPGGFPGQGNPNYPGPYGAGPTPGAGGIGSGLASGIATGVGIGAGMAAGNALAGSLFGKHEGNDAQSGTDQNDFGMTDTSWGNDSGDLGLGSDDDSWV